MLWVREAGTSPFLCPHRRHVEGTPLKLAHTKRILVHFFVVVWKVCESRAHDPTLKIEVILSLLQCDAQIQTSWRIILRGQTFVNTMDLGKLLLQHVVARGPGVPSVCQPNRSLNELETNRKPIIMP